jgi:hypothetical protein
MLPLPRAWLTPATCSELWDEAGGTYRGIPYEALPTLHGLDGSFGWLRPVAPLDERMVFEHQRDEPVQPIVEARAAEARDAGLVLPESFGKFMTDPDLTVRVPSCTACYYDIGARLVSIPGRDGPERLLRFLNDQQACCIWYLLLEREGQGQVAFAIPEWTNTNAGTLDDAITPRELTICALSFEEFIKRFWIENTIWLKVNNGEALTGELQAYADAARAGLARLQTTK